MRTFRFEAGYYEWHLTDAETGEILHNMEDPSDDLIFANNGVVSKRFIEYWCREELITADIEYSENMDYNGILLSNEKRLDQIEEIPVAAKLMANTLYNYYIK